MKTQLLIELYEKRKDDFVNEIDISKYDLEKINKICPPKDQFDIEYCNSYLVGKAEFDLLKKYIKELLNYEYKDYVYVIITRQI